MAKNIFPSTFISLADIYLAYKKAKSEAFFDNFHPSALSFSLFEQDLQKNIESLHTKIVKEGFDWWNSIDFIGGYLYVPKSVDDSPWNSKDAVHYRSIDPTQDWEHRFIESRKLKLDANYRLIITATVEYQIISAIWILKVGHKFEAKLDKNLSFGNRLRRRSSIFEKFIPFSGPVNHDSLGLFSPYFSAYQKWRNNGLVKMQQLLNAGRSVTAITMDLAGFYHNTSPDFVLRPSFLKAIEVDLNKPERKLTQLLLASMTTWYQSTPDHELRPTGALPVGLSASKIISNILLYDLDKQIKNSITPAYYGRYVDDIFLVFTTPENISNGDSTLKYLAKKVECLSLMKDKDSKAGLKVKFAYASDSELIFAPQKQKIFHLSSSHGLDLINQIKNQIKAQSSEYRMLPEVPRDSVAMAEKALLASPDASLTADALRKADVVSIRRLGLSLLLRDIESYSVDLSRDDWRDLREEFYGLVERYLVTPKGIFELFGYFPRVFLLMVSNYDFKHAIKFINSLSKCFDLLERTTNNPKSKNNRLNKCKDYFSKVLLQATLQASTTKSFEEWGKIRTVIKKIGDFSNNSDTPTTKSKIKLYSHQLLLADLGARSYKDFWYYTQTNSSISTKVPKSVSVRKVLRLGLIRKFRESAQLSLPHWPALVFPTRPLSVQEIALVCPKVLDDEQLFRDCIMGLRGARTIGNKKIGHFLDNADGNYLNVPMKEKNCVNIALTNFETTKLQFEQALNGTPNRSLLRYEKINKLINDILRNHKSPDYVVFPECSVPRRWAMSIASKLAKQAISLIAGLEYYSVHNDNKILRNDCLVSLATRWPGYNSNFLFLQPKLQPSHGELKLLKHSGKKQYIPSSSVERLPIYNHGSFQFGVLICSDLTTPSNRVRFQGKVDSLFVLEWNPDVKTFSFLIEGAAHDIHTFVIQVNNRLFGDSRVRAPYRVDYKRDSVRIKGGLTDYFVIAEIDYQALRRFQRKRTTSEQDEFKPVPIGFQMSKLRKRPK